MAWPWGNKRRFWEWFALAILLLVSGYCVFLYLHIVPLFGQIFTDALPGKPLPGLTRFILGTTIPLALFNALIPLVGAVLTWRQIPSATVWVKVGIFVGYLQIGIVIYALFSPMVGLSIGMSDATPGR